MDIFQIFEIELIEERSRTCFHYLRPEKGVVIDEKTETAERFFIPHYSQFQLTFAELVVGGDDDLVDFLCQDSFAAERAVADNGGGAVYFHN